MGDSTRKENNGDQILPDVAAAVNVKMEEKGISKEEVEASGSVFRDR